MILLYHAGCFDGFTAAWAWWYFIQERGGEFTQYIGARYGDEPPYEKLKAEDVLMVDFSYPRAQLERIRHDANSILILDHHATAKSDLEGFPEAVFDMDRCGCVMLWDEEIRFRMAHEQGDHPTLGITKRPWLLEYVQERDLWKFRLPKSLEVAAVVSSIPMTFEHWSGLYERVGAFPVDDPLAPSAMEPIVREGEAIMRYQRQYGQKGLAEARSEMISDYLVPCVNMPYMNCSEYVGWLLERSPTAAFAAGYFRRADGKWQFSLRSRPDFDCSQVARLYGGGGHPQAAGFQVEVLPWEESRMGTTMDGGAR